MLLIILVSVFLGAVITLVLQACILYFYHYSQPVVATPRNRHFERAQMDQDLADASLLGIPESCNALNTLIAFLFREMKDTIAVRTWIIKKMNVEFDELLQSKTAGRLLEQIKVRDYCLGPSFPTIKEVILSKATPREPCTVPEEVDVSVDLEYEGGFRVTVDVDLAFGTSAYISITIKKLTGRARLRFTRIPYSHWSFSFYDEPEIEFEVKSHFEGRTFPQLGSVIVNQLKKTLKKKHTLPNYKMRYKPFFVKAVPPHANADMYLHDSRLVVGKMTVVLIEGSRLAITNEDSEVYCNIAVDSVPLNHEDIFKRYPGEVYEVEIIKNSSKSIGVIFTSALDESEVFIESIQPNTPASLTELKRGDILLSVNGIDINSSKDAVKLIKNAKEKCKLRVQRPTQPVDAADGKVEFVDQTQENDYDDFISDTISTLGYSPQEQLHGLPKQVTAAAASLSESISPILRRRNNPESRPQHKRRASWGAMDSTLEPYLDLKSESTHSLGLFLKDSERAQIAAKTQAREHSKSLPFNGMSPSDPDLDTISLASCPPDFLEDGIDAQILSTGDARQRKGDFESACLPASRDINWDEIFEFDLEDSDKFLNICVWNRVKGQLGERDIPIGYCSVPLMNVALQCLTTLSGEHQEMFKLFPPQQKAGASRHPAYANLYRHSGFEGTLCYGDVTLGFHHSPFERQELSLEEINAKEEELKTYGRDSQDDHFRQETNVKKRARPDDLSLVSTKRHVFVGTQFSAQTRCGFCNKKVWTKYAYQCKVCKLICHKKCSEKTQAQMPCDILLGRPKSDLQSPARDIQLKVPVAITPMLSPSNSAKNTPLASPTSSPPGSPVGSPPSSDDEEDVDELVRSIHSLKEQLRKMVDPGGTKMDTDAMFMSAAREMGRELYIDLPVNERKDRLEIMITKLQQEIDHEAEKRAHLAQDNYNARTSSREATVAGKILKSEQRMEDLRLLMIHYCAGMQHCNEALSKD